MTYYVDFRFKVHAYLDLGQYAGTQTKIWNILIKLNSNSSSVIGVIRITIQTPRCK